MPELYRRMMTRSLQPEIMDEFDGPPEIARRFYRDLALIHRLMGNGDQIIQRLAKDGAVRSVLDIGCGDGTLLAEIRDKLGIRDVTGVDLRPPCHLVPGIPIIRADATRDLLPSCDAAVCMMMLHHLTDADVVDLIHNVGRSAKRLICLDLVRHPLPLVLYTIFVCPLLGRVGAQDGRQSIRRAFTGPELRELAEQAVAGTSARITHWVSRVHARQVLDIRWDANLSA